MTAGGKGRVVGLVRAAALVLALACSPERSPEPGPGTDARAPDLAKIDLPGIRDRGTLRLLIPRSDETARLPRSGWPVHRERELAERLCRELGLVPEWVPVDTHDDLLPALVEGRGDLVVDNLTVTSSRLERVAFSAPVTSAREQVVTRANDEALQGPADLRGRRVVVRRSSSYWESLQNLRRRFPGIAPQPAPEGLAVDEILERVADGIFDVTLADSNLVAAVLEYRDDLRVAFELDRTVSIAWALRKEASLLRRAVDTFLARRRTTRVGEPHRDDLPGIRKRGVLRVLTRNNAANYYLWNGRLMGFEYELAREFAKRHELTLEMIVPPSQADLLPWLREGRGDVVAASLTRSEARAKREGVVFSRPTNRVHETVIARPDALPDDVEDLAGRRFWVRRKSHYWNTLDALRQSGVPLELAAVPPNMETEEIIERVATGQYDLTLADGHVVDIEMTWREDVRPAFTLGEPVEHAWAVRPGNPELLAAIDAFFDEEYRGTLYNVLAARYFREPKRIRTHAADRVHRVGRITPWDAALQKYAFAYGFDWRLLAAQMHQESRFDPDAISFAGARGLMQVMPRTAREVGIEDVTDPESGIHAGVRYLAWMRDRFGDDMPTGERTWFALAAYNAGHGHVRDAQKLAAERGLDPNRWFGNVEQAIRLKRKREIARRTRFGWCRCDEPVRYVRAIRDRYRGYVQAAAGLPLESPADDWLPELLRGDGWRRPPG